MTAPPARTLDTPRWRMPAFQVVAGLTALLFLTNLRLLPAPWVLLPGELGAPNPELLRWHDATMGAVSGILGGGCLLVLALRPLTNILLLQFEAVATLVGVLIIAPVTGPYIFLIALPILLLVALYPARRALLDVSRAQPISRPLLGLTLVTALLLAPDIGRSLNAQLQGLGGELATSGAWIANVEHSVLLLLAGGLASTKRPGWQVLGMLVGLVYLYLGAAAFSVPQHPGSWGSAGGSLALVVGALYVAATVREVAASSSGRSGCRVGNRPARSAYRTPRSACAGTDLLHAAPGLGVQWTPGAARSATGRTTARRNASMDVQDALARAALAPEHRSPGAGKTRRSGSRRHLAQVGMLVLVLLTIGAFAVAVPLRWRELATLCSGAACADGQLTPESARALKARGLPAGFPAAYTLGLEVSAAVMFFTAGLLVYWRRSSERIALVVALALVLFGATYNSVLEALATRYGVLATPVALLENLAFVLFFVCFYLFPDGRFTPRWTLPLAAGWGVLATLGTVVPGSVLNAQRWPSALNAAILGGLLLSAAGAQVYRYRRVSGPLERQQTKWVLLGFLVASVGFLAVVLLDVRYGWSTDDSAPNGLVAFTILYACLESRPAVVGTGDCALSPVGHRSDHQPHAGLRRAQRRGGGPVCADRRLSRCGVSDATQPARLAGCNGSGCRAVSTAARAAAAWREPAAVRRPRRALHRARAPWSTP